MLFGIFDHIFKHVAGGEISDLGAVGNGFAKQLHIFTFKFQIDLEEVLYRTPSTHLTEMRDLRCPLQIQNVIDQARRMADFFIDEMAEMLMQSLIAPILAHGRME